MTFSCVGAGSKQTEVVSEEHRDEGIDHAKNNYSNFKKILEKVILSDNRSTIETLNKVTIIILAHYSDYDVSRILDYYGDVNVHILVADSSIVPFPHYKQYENVRYFHYANNMSFHEKMEDIFNHVNTPYVQLCGDDDFIVPTGIISCVEFLERNADYAAVQGHVVSFAAKRSGVFTNPLYLQRAGLDIKTANTAERLKLSMNPYMHWFYSVHRTVNLKFYFQAIHSQIPNQALCEVALTLISAINGNLKILPIFYAARDKYKSTQRHVPPSVLDAKTNPELKAEYDDFLSLVIDYFCNKTGSSQVESRRCVERGIEKYFQPHNEKKAKKVPLIPVVGKKATQVLRPFLPKSLLQYRQRLVLKRLIGDIPGYPFFDLEAKNEWEVIKSYILKHNWYSEQS